MHLSSNTPSIQVLVRNEFLHNQEKGHGGYTRGWLVGCRTVRGFAVTFYVLLENGVLFTGLPIHALAHKECERMELTDLEMWDSISYDHSVVQFELLKRIACIVLLKNKKRYDGEYVFSIDFSSAGSLRGIAESPNEWKVFHFIKLNNGNFALYPQNRIMFKDASLISSIDPKTIDYKVNTTEWGCEDGNKWTVGDDANYLYGLDK